MEINELVTTHHGDVGRILNICKSERADRPSTVKLIILETEQIVWIEQESLSSLESSDDLRR